MGQSLCVYLYVYRKPFSILYHNIYIYVCLYSYYHMVLSLLALYQFKVAAEWCSHIILYIYLRGHVEQVLGLRKRYLASKNRGVLSASGQSSLDRAHDRATMGHAPLAIDTREREKKRNGCAKRAAYRNKVGRLVFKHVFGVILLSPAQVLRQSGRF